MNHCDEELRKAVALFRYGLIADVLRLPPGSREIRHTLREKAQRTYTIPGTRRTRVVVETMRDWLSLYRNGGFEALYPKTRADRGQPRRLPPEVAELLVSLKTEQPARSVKALIQAAHERGVDHPLAPSTVHRLLSGEGLLDKRPGEPVATDRRRFAFRDAGELWMSDVMHGPKVSDARRRRNTFLIAFIDEQRRTRRLPHPTAATRRLRTPPVRPPCRRSAVPERARPAQARQPHRPLRPDRRRPQQRPNRQPRTPSARRRGTPAMNLPHLVCDELSDQAAVYVNELLNALAAAFESQHLGQLLRYYYELRETEIECSRHDGQLDLFEGDGQPY